MPSIKDIQLKTALDQILVPNLIFILNQKQKQKDLLSIKSMKCQQSIIILKNELQTKAVALNIRRMVLNKESN